MIVGVPKEIKNAERRVGLTSASVRELVAHGHDVIVETLLPLGKLDPGLREPEIPLDIREFGALAAIAEDVGVDAVLVEETKDDPYQLLALGAAARWHSVPLFVVRWSDSTLAT